MLNKIATLGPQGTFSEVATKSYLKTCKLDLDIEYYSSIKKALSAIGSQVQMGMLPIENLSEGYVNLVLDHLIDADLYICAELLLPIQFSLVSYTEKISEIDTVYVQFVAKGQCAEYLDALEGAKFISTESNSQSLHSLEGSSRAGAVVPSHMLGMYDFSTVVENINDYSNNQTRFLLFAAQPNKNISDCSAEYKTSLIVLDDDDRPGYLEGILAKFTKRQINLTSIASRPTRQTFGKYHFFIDLDGHQQDANVAAALSEIRETYKVRVLGSYPKAT